MVTETGSQAGAESQGAGGTGTRRKLSEDQEREVTRLYAETETPVSEISKRFGIGESSVYRVAQRHGAALRGRTATTSAPSRPAAAAKQAAAGPGRGRRGRAPGTAAKTAAKTSSGATTDVAATPSTNGRRTGAKRAAAGAATPVRRTAATTTRGTRVPRGTRAAVVA